MIHRRGFIYSVAGLGVAAARAQAATEDDRQYWLRQLTRIADPVLENLAAGTLKRNMPVECANGKLEERRRYTHLEAIGRLLAGIAPWLEVELNAGAERDLQQRYRDLARAALDQATDPASPDFLNFHEGSQPLAASRAISPPANNWLMFAATVETALAHMGEPWDEARVDNAILEHQQWYLGDGVYGDGPRFHWGS